MRPVRVVQDTKYSDMYRLEWENGVKSEDMYNLSRANDILRNYDSYIEAMRQGERMKNNKLASCSRKLTDKSLEIGSYPTSQEEKNLCTGF